MTTYIDFDTAKLLKEKGYNLPQKKIYTILGQLWDAHYATMTNSDVDSGACCTAPTIAEVVMWLYEKHGIWIGVDHNKFDYLITKRKTGSGEVIVENEQIYKSPTEAYLEAIKYCLTKLI